MARKNGLFSLAVLVSVACMSAAVHADENQPTVRYSIGIKGMTCETCAAHVQQNLLAVAGVVKASVDYKTAHAGVTVETPRQPARTTEPRRISRDLAAAIEKAGYKPTVNYVLNIKGMTCEACSQHITTALGKVAGVATASVSYKGGYAVVVPSAHASPNPKHLVRAIEEAGYEAVLHTGP